MTVSVSPATMHVAWLKHATDTIESSGTEVLTGDQCPSTEVTKPPALLTAMQNREGVHDTEVRSCPEMCSGADHDRCDPFALKVIAFPVWSTATQNSVDAHETDVTAPPDGSIWSVHGRAHCEPQKNS